MTCAWSCWHVCNFLLAFRQCAACWKGCHWLDHLGWRTTAFTAHRLSVFSRYNRSALAVVSLFVAVVACSHVPAQSPITVVSHGLTGTGKGIFATRLFTSGGLLRTSLEAPHIEFRASLDRENVRNGHLPRSRLYGCWRLTTPFSLTRGLTAFVSWVRLSWSITRPRLCVTPAKTRRSARRVDSLRFGLRVAGYGSQYR